MNNIRCTHCGKEIEISEALTHQLKGEIADSLEKEFEKKLQEAQIKAAQDGLKKATESLDLKLKDKENEAKEAQERSAKLQEQLLEMNKAFREMKTKDEQRELEMQKKLSLEGDKIRIEATKKAEEEQHMKILAKDKQLADTLKELEDAKRKLQQGSQQTQGEVFELEFEKQLVQHYPNDKVLPVSKGMRGADVIQEVWDRNGNMVGKILWELKNTRTWQEPWIEKLKVDQRAINAEEAVLITEIMPADLKLAGFRNSVWVTGREFVFPLADTLRAKLIQLYYVKNSVKGKDAKMEILYSYLSGTEFKHRVEAIIEAFSNMQQEIEKEKRYFANKWARDEKNIRAVIDSTYGMHGDLKGIVGASLPQIKGLEQLGDGESD